MNMAGLDKGPVHCPFSGGRTENATRVIQPQSGGPAVPGGGISPSDWADQKKTDESARQRACSRTTDRPLIPSAWPGLVRLPHPTPQP
jgi:hypothetical protein